MVNIVPAWTPQDTKDSFQPSRRLQRSEYDWEVPLKVLGDGKPAITESKFAPVMPAAWANGRFSLIPMFEEAFQLQKFEDYSAVSDEEEGSYPDSMSSDGSEDDQPWNQNLLPSTDSKSLFRVVLTHDFSTKDILKPRGLFNTRNMCFFNSVLQVLVHCSPFNALLQNIIYNVPFASNDHSSLILSAFSEFLFSYGNVGDTRRAMSGEPFYDVICEHTKFHVERNRQEDAQEFMSDLLDVLETSFRNAPPSEEDIKDDLLSVKRQELTKVHCADQDWTEVGKNSKKIETQHAGRQDLKNPIDLLFGGKFRSVFQKQGSKPSITTEPFQQIMLDISEVGINSTQIAVDMLLQEENLDLGSTQATKKSEFEHLPSILIVQIKRFTFIMQDGDYELGKITKPVVVDEILTLNSILNGKVNYRPIGIVYHHGLSATRGHYTADVLVEDQWFRIDDEQVVPVNTDDVVGLHSANGGGSRSAYMVFYEKL